MFDGNCIESLMDVATKKVVEVSPLAVAQIQSEIEQKELEQYPSIVMMNFRDCAKAMFAPLPKIEGGE